MLLLRLFYNLELGPALPTFAIKSKAKSLLSAMSIKRGAEDRIGNLNKSAKPTPTHPFFNLNGPVDGKDIQTSPGSKMIWGVENLPLSQPDTLVVGRTESFKFNGFEWVLALDLDGTLIRVRGTHVHAKSADDWQWHNTKVVETLKKYNEMGAGLVIFSNQSGLEPAKIKAKGADKLVDFKAKVQQISHKLKLPFILLVATGNDRYRKPRVGMWEYLEKLCGCSIDRKRSIFVGDAAGRPATTVPKRKRDFSDTDRKLALNIGLKFFTPEEFFLSQPSQEYTLTGFDANAYLAGLKEQSQQDKLDIQLMNTEKLELILMVGFPGSGKTSAYERYLKPHGYEWINNDTLKSKPRCLSMTEEHLSSKRSVVIDNTNLDAPSRKPYIDIAKKYGAQVRCFVFSIRHDLCKHNALYRSTCSHPSLANGKPIAIIPDMAFFSLAKKYQRPDITEGIDSIETYPFIPLFSAEWGDSKLNPAEQEKEWSLYYF